ncbi:hypothetical protein AB7D55_002962 [Vibrio mimicus]
MIKHALMNLISAGLLRANPFLITIYTANNFSKSEFGEFSFFQSTSAVIAFVCLAGVSSTIIKKTSELKDEIFLNEIFKPTLIGLSFFYSLIISVLVLFVLLLLEYVGLINGENLIPLVLIAFFSINSGFNSGFILGAKNYFILCKASFLVSIFTFFSISFNDYFSLGLNPTYILVSYYIGYSVILFYLNDSYKFLCSVARMDIKIVKDIFSFGLPIFLSGLLYLPVIWVMISHLNIEYGLEMVAEFNPSYQLYIIMTFISSTISQVMLQKFSGKEINGLTKPLAIMFSIMMVVSIVIYYFGLDLLMLFGKEYVSTKQVFNYFIITGVISSLCFVSGNFIVSKFSGWYSFILNLIWSFSALLIYFNCLKSLAASAIPVSLLFAYLILFISTIIIVAMKNEKKCAFNMFR